MYDAFFAETAKVQSRLSPAPPQLPIVPSSPKYATYLRDDLGLDYADQRYFNSGWGRFMTPDPYQASGGPASPASWNRYAYVEGDPVNYYDPEGLFAKCPAGTVTGPDGKSCIAEPTSVEIRHTAIQNAQPLTQPERGEGGGPTFSKKCLDGIKDAKQSKVGVARAIAARSTLESAAQKHGIDWKLVAAIGIMETNFKSGWEQKDGKDWIGRGAGVFQIDLSKNPSVTEQQAFDLEWAADWAANRLRSNYDYLQAKFGDVFDSDSSVAGHCGVVEPWSTWYFWKP